MKELISVIIPVYNVEQYLKRSLDSILRQTYHNLEIILVDDGSTDNSGPICDEYAKKDKRIKVIHKQNGGQSEARNMALDIAKGQYIGFIDSDDYIEHDMYEVLYNNLIKYNADVSITNIIIRRDSKEEIVENYKELEFYNRENVMQALLRNKITNYTVNKLYKKELWEGIRFPIGRILEDMDIMYKVLERTSNIVCTNKTAYYYMMREDSSISRINVKVTNDLKEAVNRRFDYLKEKQPELINELTITRLYNILQYYDNLAYCREKEIYNSEEYNKEYKFYKQNFKKYKNQLCKDMGIRKKKEVEILYKSKEIYYYYSIIKNIIKSKLRR